MLCMDFFPKKNTFEIYCCFETDDHESALGVDTDADGNYIRVLKKVVRLCGKCG